MTTTKTKNSFHFSVGNSSHGHIGFCARVFADTPQEAAELLKEGLPEYVPRICNGEAFEYTHVYFNPDAIDWRKDIDEYTDEDGEDCAFDPADWEGS